MCADKQDATSFLGSSPASSRTFKHLNTDGAALSGSFQVTESPITSGTILVTGGTGSFGSTMVRRLLQSGVDEIR
ncbi:MAG: Polysaccharide biosynthesis protein, partial [Marmoricola sp.]|nr:Polysaccharide biosynthesis protein [Marmoricola sp.]